MKKFAPILFALTAACCAVALGQEMEPRAYSRAPVGAQFVLLTYAYQSGDVFTDSSLPLRDVKVKLSSGSLAYGRTFGLAGRQASASLFVPYIKGNASGTVFEEQVKVTRSGLGDVRVRFMINLIGSPALHPKEFAAYKARTVVGASVTVIAPSGQYDSRRLVNLSSNRWAFKPEVGLSKPAGQWTLEMADIAAGQSDLHLASANVGGGERELLQRRANDCEWSGQCRSPGKFAGRGHRFDSLESAAVHQGSGGQRCDDANRRPRKYGGRCMAIYLAQMISAEVHLSIG